MQAAAISGVRSTRAAQAGLAPGARRRGGGGRRRGTASVRAAAAAEQATDLGALFRDALSMPAAPKAAAPPAAVAAPAADAAAPVTVGPVPGTEILSSTAPPQPPPVPTQGMDIVLEQLRTKPPGYGAPAAKAAKAAAAPLTDSLGEGLASASKGLGEAGAAASKGLASAADGAADALGGAASALTGAATGAADAAAGASAAAAAAAAQAADALQAALSGAAGGVGGAAGGAASSAQQLVGAAAAELASETAALRESLDTLLGGVAGSVGGVTSAVGGTSSAVSSSLGAQLSELTAAVNGAAASAADSAASLLPPGAAEALAAAAGAAAAAAAQVAGLEPTTGAAVAAAGLGLPALLVWQAVYGGYAGPLAPLEAFDALQKGDALLVDVRPEAARLERGVPELRRGALGKGVAVSPVQLPPSVAKRLRDPAGVALEALALRVAALARLNRRSTRVIVMDERGDGAKRVARALRAAGVRRPYVLAGGFRAWQAEGLAVRGGTADYDASPLAAVEDVAGTVAEQAASQLSKPRNAALAAAVLGLGGYAALNFHTALQFVGVLGLELTLVGRAMSYGSLEEALDDARALASSAAGLAALPGKAAAAVGGAAAAARQAAGDGKA